MNSKSIFGITVIVVGLVLLGFAQHASEAPADQISDMMTGRYSDTTVTYFVVGIAAVVFGILSIVFGRRA
ncbi:DUF3185 family protein [Magnetovibrio blakemorei]|uniref:DUF3185 family protein n=1 Tax=Magnetovibrio blakemorei TaxID=28181 RepID=A0A1E5Q512_9PROT|nr:DUF3185 family protein [Magnetovibrio blakemorei]OEJ65261.1 hypothetical protein BEN30_15015 [Magnetovibrio blakemorei]